MGRRKEIQLIEEEIAGEKVYSKQCTSCNEVKKLTDYHRSDHGLGGRTSKCKLCKGKFVKKYNKTDMIKNPVFEIDGKRFKFCSDCQESKGINEFYPHGTSYTSKCKPCYGKSRRKGTGPKPIVIITVNGVESKECRSCEVVKPLAQFSLNSDGKGVGGRRAFCKECMRDYWKAKRSENRENNILSTRKWRLSNPEKQAESKRNWRKNNKHKDKVYQNKRKTRELALRTDLTNEQWEEVLLHFNHACALSGQAECVTMDHFIPISIGKGGTYVGNVYPLAPTLNYSKHNRNPFEWFNLYGTLHGIDASRWNKLISYLASANDMSDEDFRKYVNALFEEGGNE